MAEWAIARLASARAARSGDGIQEKKPRKWCWYKKGDIIGRSTDRHQGSFLSPGWKPAISEADLASMRMDNHQDTRSHSDTMSLPLLPQKEGIGSLLRFLIKFALFIAFVFVLQNEVNKKLFFIFFESEGSMVYHVMWYPRTEYLTSEK